MKAGDKHFRLTAQRPVGPPRNQWSFRCDCGSVVIREATKVRAGHTKSCGCYRSEQAEQLVMGRQEKRSTTAADMAGLVFNRLTVLELDRITEHRVRMWRCKCECGELVTVAGPALRSGRQKSCGCFRVEHSREMLPKHKAKGDANRSAGISKTRLGTRVIRRDGITVHRMDAINDGGRSLTHPGPSKYGKPDLFVLQWPAPGTVEVGV